MMENIVLFRLKDDEALWVADLEAGTVERADSAAIANDSGVKGLDFAVVARSRPAAPGHLMYPST
jgi:hypothetical protein